MLGAKYKLWTLQKANSRAIVALSVAPSLASVPRLTIFDRFSLVLLSVPSFDIYWSIPNSSSDW